jgi:hypothetical protein
VGVFVGLIPSGPHHSNVARIEQKIQNAQLVKNLFEEKLDNTPVYVRHWMFAIVVCWTVAWQS